MSPSRHPVNKVLVDDAPLGARVADAVTGFLGSWRFIILQTVIVLACVRCGVDFTPTRADLVLGPAHYRRCPPCRPPETPTKGPYGVVSVVRSARMRG